MSVIAFELLLQLESHKLCMLVVNKMVWCSISRNLRDKITLFPTFSTNFFLLTDFLVGQNFLYKEKYFQMLNLQILHLTTVKYYLYSFQNEVILYSIGLTFDFFIIYIKGVLSNIAGNALLEKKINFDIK